MNVRTGITLDAAHEHERNGVTAEQVPGATARSRLHIARWCSW